MNRMEGGGEQGVERNTGAAGNSPTGTGTAATQAAPGLVGQAGSLVGSGHMLPPAVNTFGSYGPMRGTREALLSEAGFEKVFRTQNWVRRSKLFCR